MSRDACRRALMEAYSAADFAIVEGEFSSVDEPSSADGGSLETLCRMLDLPRLIILDAAQAADCRIPARPDAVDGVLIDGIADYEQFFQIQTCLEGAWGVPVVGGLARDEGIRQALVSLPPGRVVPENICKALATSFAQFVEPRLLNAIVDRPALPIASTPAVDFRKPANGDRPTIAVAYDDAFCGYFPELLEELERGGARVVDFSPLHDECVPERADTIWLGCGRTDFHAEALSDNLCMHASLRNFARRGGRIYAEGGGCAYLGRTLKSADGIVYPMVNLLPLAAERRENGGLPVPVEFTPVGENWLLPECRTLRAYRNRRWKLELLEPIETLHEVDGSPTLVATGNVVGGLMQIHFGAAELLPALLESPCEPAAQSVATSWPT